MKLYRACVTALGATVKLSGIYLIYHPKGPVLYVGQTRQQFISRWEGMGGHIPQLKSGKHPNDALRACWRDNKDIGVTILEVVAVPEQLHEREQWWIRRLGYANERR